MRKHDPTKGNYDRISDAIIFMYEMKQHDVTMVHRRVEKNAFYERTLFGDEVEEQGLVTTPY